MSPGTPRTRKSLLTLFDRCTGHLRAGVHLPHKRVGAHRYYHLKSCDCARLADRAAELLNSEYDAGASADDIVAKLHDWEGVSLLVYEHFVTDPHPALRLSVRLKQQSSTPVVRRYRSNPPVLHRKELLLEPSAPAFADMRALTEAEQAAGLLAQPTTIGFRKQWNLRLESMGYTIDGLQLKKVM